MNISRRVSPILLAGVLLLWAHACGKKAPPFLPQEQITAHVVDLRGEPTEGGILLQGAIRGLREPDGIQELAGARVFYARYPIEDPPCEDCPIEYRTYRDLGDEAFTTEGFQGEIPVQPDPQIYFLKVHLIGRDGAVGPASDRVKVIME